MYKKFVVPNIVPEGCHEQPRVLDVEIPDEWSKLRTDEQDALTKLMEYYLQKRWDEQYKKILNKEQNTILFTLLKLRALEDLKRDIRYTIFYKNLEKLTENILSAHAAMKEKQVTNQKKNPVVLDEKAVSEMSQVKSKKM